MVRPVTRGGRRLGAGRQPTTGSQPRIATTVTPDELSAIDEARALAAEARAAVVRAGAVEMARRTLTKRGR